MSTSPKQCNAPNFQSVDIKGRKHKRQENVNKSRIATKSSESRYSESWLVRSSQRENDISQDDIQEPSSQGKQTNLFYRSLQEISCRYQPSSFEEDWTDSDSEDEESKEEEETNLVTNPGLSETPILKLNADRTGAHGNNLSSFGQLKSSQKKRGTSRHQELMESNSYFGKPRLFSTKLSQSSRSGRRKTVKFETKKYTSRITDGGDRKHHQGMGSEMLSMDEEDAESGESWYDQRSVDLPASAWWTGRSSHQSEVVKFEDYPAIKTSLSADQTVVSREINAERPDINGSRGLRDLSTQSKYLHGSDKRLTRKAAKKGSSKPRHRMSSTRTRMKHHATFEESANESDSHREASLGGDGNKSHIVEDLSIFELEEVDTKFLQEGYDVRFHSPVNSDSLLSLDGGTQGSCEDEYTTLPHLNRKGNIEKVDHLKGESDLMSSLQNVDSVEDLLLQYEEDIADFRTPFGVKGLYEKDPKLGEPKPFLKGGLNFLDEHYYDPISSHFESARSTLPLETGLHDESFTKVQDRFLSSEYSYPKDDIVKQTGSKHLQDFLTARKEFPSEVWSTENRAISRLGEEGSVERMVSDVILSQSEVMSQLVESSPNSSKSPRQTKRTERLSVSWDIGNSVPGSTVHTNRQVWANAEETVDSFEVNSTTNTEPSHHGHKPWDSIASKKGHNDPVSLSLQDLSMQNQCDKSKDRHHLGTFSPNLDSKMKYVAEGAIETSLNSVDGLLLSRNPQMSSINRTTDITANFSMQQSSVFLEKHIQRKSATSKHKLPLEKTVLNEESHQFHERDVASLHPNSENNPLPNSVGLLHSRMSRDKSSDQKSAKKSLKFELSSENATSTLTSDHHNHQGSLQDEPLVLSSRPGCFQQTDVSLDSLKFNSKSSKFQGKIGNESSNNSNGKDHQREAAFHEREEGNMEVRPLGEIENKNKKFSKSMRSLPDSIPFTSENASVKVNFPIVSMPSDFTQSMHLSELGASDLEAGEEDGDNDEMTEIRRESGKKEIFDEDSGSHVVQTQQIENQEALKKMWYGQRGRYDQRGQYDWKGQYDKRKQYHKRIVIEDEAEMESGIKVKRSFHGGESLSSTNTRAQSERYESNKVVPEVGYDHGRQYGSRTLLHDLPGDPCYKSVMNAYSLPAIVDSHHDASRPPDVWKEFRDAVKELKTESKQEKSKDRRGQTGVLSSLHSRTTTPQRSLLQDVTLLSGLGWTVRVRNVLRETPKKNHGEMVSKAYWLKRWRISTRVQKMLRAEEEGQMQSAILFHEVSLLHKYLTAWKTITRRKELQSSQFHQKYLLRKGMRALQSSVREREVKVKHLEEKIQQGELRSSFQMWQTHAKLHQDHGLIAVMYNDRNRLVFAFHKWREKFGLKQKERVSNLHYKLHLLSSHFAKWKIYISDRKVSQEQKELARVFLEEKTLRVSWETLKTMYHKRVAAHKQDRRCLLAKVIRSWRHGAKLSRLETIEDHHKAQEFRRASLLRTHLALWREEVVISQARRKLEVVTLRYAFDLWKLKLERKNLVARIVASKLRKASKLRVLSAWSKKTHENRERRIEGTRIFETFLLRRLFQAWKMLVDERRERSSKALLWSHHSHRRRKMQLFTSWRRRTQEKQQMRAMEEHHRQLLVGKFAMRWRQVVKLKQDEVKVQTLQEKRRIKIVKVAFSTWVAAFDQTVEDQQRAAEAQETLAQNKVHRAFLSWRLAAREGAVIKPLLEKRRLKKMSRKKFYLTFKFMVTFLDFAYSIFTSWYKIAQQKKIAQQMCEQKKQRTLALAYYAWRQQYLAVLQQRIVVEAHARNHLQRVFRAWHLVPKRKKIAEKFALGCKEEMLKRSFLCWKEKTEEMELRKERVRGSEAREIVLKKTYLRRWLRKITEQRDEEDVLCSRISEMQERDLLVAAFCEWKYSHHRETQAREHKKTVANRKLKTILTRWHQHAKYSFQRSLELFTRSLQMTTPRAYSEEASEISRLAAASESSFLSETQQFSVVDSGYHGNHATLTGLTLDSMYIQASSDVVSAAEFSDGDVMSYQSFKTFSEEHDNSVYSSPRHNGTVKSDEISYAYSSSQSFVQMECANDLGETILLEGEHSNFPNSNEMTLSITEENNNANDGSSLNDDYAHIEEKLNSSASRNEFYQQHWSHTIQSSSNFVEISSEPGTSMKALSSSTSLSEAGASSTSSHHLCTVKHQSPESNALRDIWLGEARERSDGDSEGEMSLGELEELDEENEEEVDLLQEDGEFQRGAMQISRVELLTYMINFWRLWPASAAFLQWLAYTKYRRNVRQKTEKFSKCCEKRRLQKCFQFWKNRSELSVRGRHHEETMKLRKHFDALRNYYCLQKKQREDKEVATRWRYERCLTDSFNSWKLQLLETYAVGGIAPSWEQYTDKAKVLQLRAADWMQTLQRKNVQECFMFWKLRYWQQVQVRAHHERVLKLRHFRAWLGWIQVRRWRCFQQETFLHQRQKSLALARWREALHEKSKVEMMRSSVNQNHLRVILISWHQYSRITREDRVHTEEIQCIRNQGTLRQYWCVWRDHLGNLMNAQRHRNEALVKRSFICWSEWTQHNVMLQKAVIQVRNISQKQILKSSFAKWQQRLEAKKKLVLFIHKQQLSLVKVYFMRWKDFVEDRRQEKKRQRDLMEQVITQWMSICIHGQKTRDLSQRSLYRWHQFVIRSRQLSQLGHEFTKRTNDRCLQASWRSWKDTSQKWKMAKEFCENSSRKCFFTRWSCLTQERKERRVKLDHIQAEHRKRMVVQYFQTWQEQFSHLQSKAEMENQFRGQRSQRLLTLSFKCWVQKFSKRKAERHHQISLERKVWSVWRTSQAQTQKVKQFKEVCQKNQLQAAFKMLQKWTSDQRVRQKLMSDCLEKREMNSLKEAFGSWKRQTNQLQLADDIYHRHLLKWNLRAWCDFHRRKKQLKLLTVDAQAMFSLNRFMRSVPGSERFLTLQSVSGNSRDVCNQTLKVCFQIWKMKLSAREAERQKLKLLTQKVVDRWRQMVEMRKYERQVEDELEKLAGKYHNQRLRRAVFVAWRQEARCQRRSREREEYLRQKYGNLWMKITSQRIIAEQMDHYWTLKRRWIRWRKVTIQSKVSKKFLKEDEASLCLEVFAAWKKAAQEGTLSQP